MPMGLTNAPAMFMQTMINLFMDMLHNGVVVFLDEVLIYGTMLEEHFVLLEKVFPCLCYWKLSKYSFLWRITTFLGFDITPEGLKISDAKV